jgi:hypothetical protein
MPRSARVQPGGYVYRVLNRGNGRMTIFDDHDDDAALRFGIESALPSW